MRAVLIFGATKLPGVFDWQKKSHVKWQTSNFRRHGMITSKTAGIYRTGGCSSNASKHNTRSTEGSKKCSLCHRQPECQSKETNLRFPKDLNSTNRQGKTLYCIAIHDRYRINCVLSSIKTYSRSLSTGTTSVHSILSLLRTVFSHGTTVPYIL